MSHRSRLGVARLDACSQRKRILSGAVPSPRSIPRPLLPRIPWRAAQPRAALLLPACTKWLTQQEGQVAQVCVPSSSQLTCRDLSRGRRICPFLSGFGLPGEKGEKGLGKGKHGLSSCKSQQPRAQQVIQRAGGLQTPCSLPPTDISGGGSSLGIAGGNVLAARAAESIQQSQDREAELQGLG